MLVNPLHLSMDAGLKPCEPFSLFELFGASGLAIPTLDYTKPSQGSIAGKTFKVLQTQTLTLTLTQNT